MNHIEIDNGITIKNVSNWDSALRLIAAEHIEKNIPLKNYTIFNWKTKSFLPVQVKHLLI